MVNDHYPYYSWLFHWGYTQFSGIPSCFHLIFHGAFGGFCSGPCWRNASKVQADELSFVGPVGPRSDCWGRMGNTWDFLRKTERSEEKGDLISWIYGKWWGKYDEIGRWSSVWSPFCFIATFADHHPSCSELVVGVVGLHLRFSRQVGRRNWFTGRSPKKKHLYKFINRCYLYGPHLF